MTSSNVTAATRFLEVGAQRYAYRRFGAGPGQPLLCLQHFTGTLDNWDPANRFFACSTSPAHSTTGTRP
jgi:pimeloyl-ACP methyl ester carboxylesterase